MIETAMVLAAGHGTRMRPLTDDRAKAMVPVGGRPLIDHTLDRLVAAGVRRAVVNVHAHADHLEAHLAHRSDIEIVISDERAELLETGGGVVRAADLLGDDPILICNIDAAWIAWADVLGGLMARWNPNHVDELFLLARRDTCLGYPGAGDFDLVDGKPVRRSGETAPYVYAGVEIFHPKLLDGLSPEPFSRNRIWDDTLAAGRVGGHVLDGYWMHVGDPDAKRAADILWTAYGT